MLSIYEEHLMKKVPDPPKDQAPILSSYPLFIPSVHLLSNPLSRQTSNNSSL